MSVARSPVRVVCISDTHTLHDQLSIPEGDVLVHAGDLTRRGSREDVRAFDAWLGSLPHPHKVVIAGNHDFCFERVPDARSWITQATYLQDEGCVVAGLRVWGSPWQPRFFDWAFNLDRGAPLREKWDRIPSDTEVLLTHGPPNGVLDRTWDGSRVGCEELRAAVARVRPRLHVFGHIHEAYGREEQDGTVFVNACSCDLEYEPVQAPIVVDL
ncbi:MAG: metallophosphatase domain-containing protein [Pseudomonadota bacterium]|nr:metallophosphatase domain-containing protein [Pseudomonadota bacterium]